MKYVSKEAIILSLSIVVFVIVLSYIQVLIGNIIHILVMNGF
jgi:hypothetical protein